MFFWRKKQTQPQTQEKPLVVIIDDEEDLCHLLRLVLLPQGFDVDTAFDGQAGLDLIRRRRPALVVLDIKMPRLNGYQVLAQMQKDPQLASIPVIIMTSLTEDSGNTNEDWARRLGVQHFITKPFDPESVIQVIQHHLNSTCAAR